MELLNERPGMRTIKTDHNTVIKQASDELALDGIKNAWRFLKALEGTKWAPKPIALRKDELEMEYVEEDPEPKDVRKFQEEFRINSVELIFELRKRAIRHGDLSRGNFRIRNSTPVLIDWDQSNFLWEDAPQERPFSDAYHIYEILPYLFPDTNRIMRRWLAVRKYLKDYKGWGKILDLGTFQGDFVALAWSDNFPATGVDNGMFNADGIKVAKSRWEQYGCRFIDADIVNMTSFKSDFTLLFSTWSYIVDQYGKDKAIQTLRHIIDDCQILFFENQTYGDGPGPEFFKTDEDIRAFLLEFATKVEPIVTIPVYERSGVSRTVWMVQ